MPAKLRCFTCSRMLEWRNMFLLFIRVRYQAIYILSDVLYLYQSLNYVYFVNFLALESQSSLIQYSCHWLPAIVSTHQTLFHHSSVSDDVFKVSCKERSTQNNFLLLILKLKCSSKLKKDPLSW